MWAEKLRNLNEQEDWNSNKKYRKQHTICISHMGILVRKRIQPCTEQPTKQKLASAKEVTNDERKYLSTRKSGSWRSGSPEVMEQMPQLTVR